MNEKTKAAVASYARSAIGALVAVYSTGTMDPMNYVKGAVAGIIPPLMRWVNPNDKGFGRDSTPQA
jgi:hypothetical protein